MISSVSRALKREIIANFCRKPGVVYSEEDFSGTEALDDADTGDNWKRLFEKMNMPTRLKL